MHTHFQSGGIRPHSERNNALLTTDCPRGHSRRVATPLAVQRYMAGESGDKLAREAGVCTRTMWLALSRGGAKIRRPGVRKGHRLADSDPRRKVTTQQEQEIVKLRTVDGWNISRIARQFSISCSAVKFILRRHGVRRVVSVTFETGNQAAA